jgi:cytochrome P450
VAFRVVFKPYSRVNTTALRECVGIHFAMMKAQLVLATITPRFSWQLMLCPTRRLRYARNTESG